MNSIVLAYPGVHQIFQLAAAAAEIGELEHLYCSLFRGPGSWAERFGRWARVASANAEGSELLPPDKVTEFPWPAVAHRMGTKLLPWRHSDDFYSNAWFAQHAAGKLRQSEAKVFVGGEACALLAMRAAQKRGMVCVLDCPGIPYWFLDQEAAKAAEQFGIKVRPSSNKPAMQAQKVEELARADVIITCSELQKRLHVSKGVPADRIHVIPLWVNTAFWEREERGFDAAPARKPGGLRVLCAGIISLRKGVPYLLEAVKQLGGELQLTLVGMVETDVKSLLAKHESVVHHDYVKRTRLREMFREHDVLVMPSLGDSFGFVALEAMAAGMPVVVSAHCGVPVPDESWRVPAANAQAIALRLRMYLDEPGLIREHGRQAAEFAVQFPPERYRNSVKSLFRAMAAGSVPGPKN